MRKVILSLVIASFICLPVVAKNSCDDTCNNKCAGKGQLFVSCVDSCKSTCVADKTGNAQEDKQNTCNNKCAGKAHGFMSCYNDCMKH